VTGPGGTHTVQYPSNEGPQSSHATYTEGRPNRSQEDLNRAGTPSNYNNGSDLRPINSREEQPGGHSPPVPAKSTMREPGNRSPVRPSFAQGTHPEEGSSPARYTQPSNQYPTQHTYEPNRTQDPNRHPAPVNPTSGLPQPYRPYAHEGSQSPVHAPPPLNTANKSPTASHHPPSLLPGIPPIPPIPENWQDNAGNSASPTRQNFSYPGRNPPAVPQHDENSSGKPLRQSGSTLANLKAAAAGIHGAGETLRGTLNQTVDSRMTRHPNPELAARNEQIIAQGRAEIERARLNDAQRHPERQGRLSSILTKIDQAGQPRQSQNQTGYGPEYEPMNQGRKTERSPGGRLRVVNE